MATLSARVNPIPITGLKNILFATDFSEPSMKAFPYVSAIAKRFGASVFPCHIITPASLVATAPMAAPSFYEAEYNAATNELDNILRSPQLQGLKTQALIASGILGDALLDQIKQNDIDLVVAGHAWPHWFPPFPSRIGGGTDLPRGYLSGINNWPGASKNRNRLQAHSSADRPLPGKQTLAAIRLPSGQRVWCCGNSPARPAGGDCRQS